MESLADPKEDRVVKEVKPPPAKPLSDELLFPNNNRVPDWKTLKKHFEKEGRLSTQHCLELIRAVSKITSNESNLLFLASPITIVGDIHGQYYDLIKLLEVGGDPEVVQYVFLGDYVDRGSFSIEVILLLYTLKLCRPHDVWLLRGNHECRQMTVFFNFREECIYKYDLSVYYAFMESFDTLPLAAVIDNKLLCVHGGLSPDLHHLNQINAINRFREPPRAGIFCDLLWSDPIDQDKIPVGSVSNDPFIPNDVRGCSFFFGYEAALEFLQKNHLLSIVRAHEAQLEGFKLHKANAGSGFPTVITIFSAPNYCDCYNNKGAVLKFQNNTLNIQQFNFSPHPYHLPNFMNVFTWSIPFVSEKVVELLYTLLTPSTKDTDHIDDEDDDSIDDTELPDSIKEFLQSFESKHILKSRDLDNDTAAGLLPSQRVAPLTSGMSLHRTNTLKKKVQSVARLLRLFRTLRQQNELIVQLKKVTPGHRIHPKSLLEDEKDAEEVNPDLTRNRFTNDKKVDKANERGPK
ncbi:uncharacterized protein LOC128884241 [Hylaeus volcanicus]|uniref:uncharacterized protein LOC128884241 n=1 Tax=Hylaeus volcanicus TaxID=313075 RepID=UPI0023B7D757|nr:uncharacterized protein LOC128884241 [Hylaeus volcanicus]